MCNDYVCWMDQNQSFSAMKNMLWDLLSNLVHICPGPINKTAQPGGFDCIHEAGVVVAVVVVADM